MDFNTSIQQKYYKKVVLYTINIFKKWNTDFNRNQRNDIKELKSEYLNSDTWKCMNK